MKDRSVYCAHSARNRRPSPGASHLPLRGRRSPPARPRAAPAPAARRARASADRLPHLRAALARLPRRSLARRACVPSAYRILMCRRPRRRPSPRRTDAFVKPPQCLRAGRLCGLPRIAVFFRALDDLQIGRELEAHARVRPGRGSACRARRWPSFGRGPYGGGGRDGRGSRRCLRRLRDRIRWISRREHCSDSHCCDKAFHL